MYTGNRKRATPFFIGLCIPLACSLWIFGCLNSNEICGDEMDIVDGKCAPRVAAETDSALPEDTDSADAGADTETEESSLPDGMGDVCTGEGTCTKDADYCDLVPGASEGTCTVQGCVVVPDDCPAGYHCFDLSVYMATLPTICQADAAK
jgi:hypothetical protein